MKNALFILNILICIFLVSPAYAEPVDGFGADTGDADFSQNRETASGVPNTASDYQTLDSLFSVYQPYLKNMSAYRPMYFLVGADPEKSKFQFSIKYRIFSATEPEPPGYRWKQNLYIAYTQTSFWNLQASSQPFDDTSYKPEFFFLTPNIYFSKPSGSHLFFQTGCQHESNGRGEDLSRSTNTAYVQPIYIFFHQRTRLGVMMAPRFMAYIANDDDTNPHLSDYRGYVDFELKAGRADRLAMGTHFRMAKKGASVQADLTYPLDKILPNKLNLYIQVQYVNVLAESLLNYTERTRALRFGFAIVR
ncbi:MAG: phospholipase A [Desulfosalsimonadaceae bacterium]